MGKANEHGQRVKSGGATEGKAWLCSDVVVASSMADPALKTSSRSPLAMLIQRHTTHSDNGFTFRKLSILIFEFRRESLRKMLFTKPYAKFVAMFRKKDGPQQGVNFQYTMHGRFIILFFKL